MQFPCKYEVKKKIELQIGIRTLPGILANGLLMLMGFGPLTLA